MSDEESDKEKFLFYADRAKSGRAGCKKCKQKIASGELRMAKAASNPFGSGVMKMWHHVDCMFQNLLDVTDPYAGHFRLQNICSISTVD
uniref:PARP-type domain-containing protein n=1 Tax=Rhodnius prolixus TaxID=13249 RepID=T1I3M7_RHOPR